MVGRIFKYDAQTAEENLNLSMLVFSKSVEELIFNESLKNVGFQLNT